MRPVSLDDRLGTRVLVHEHGRITAGNVVGMRQAEGAELSVTVALEEVQAREARRITIPASEAIVDTVGLHQLATTQTSILFLREDLERHKQRVEVLTRERDEALADLAESRRAFETAVDDQQIEDASTAEKIATLTRDRDEARDKLDAIAEALDDNGIPEEVDGPEGRTITLGLVARVEHMIWERAEAERLRDRLQTVVDEQVSPHETLTAEELIALLEHSLAEGRHERERLRGALERAERALQGIATAQRFDRDVFSDDSAYVDWARSLSLHVAEIARAALAGEGELPRCAWKEDQDGVWHTACGSSWVYLDCDGAPADHGQKFCHACGHQLDATPSVEDEEEEEAPAPEVPDMGPQVVDVPATRSAEEVRDA